MSNKRGKWKQGGGPEWVYDIYQGKGYRLVFNAVVKPTGEGEGEEFQIKANWTSHAVNYIPEDWSKEVDGATCDWCKNWVRGYLAKHEKVLGGEESE